MIENNNVDTNSPSKLPKWIDPFARHKKVRVSRVVKHQRLGTYKYRRWFRLALVVLFLLLIGLGYAIYAISMAEKRKTEAKASFIQRFDSRNVIVSVVTKDPDAPKTYILKNDFDNLKGYSFTGKGLDLQEQDITKDIYYVTDERPEFIPWTIKRAYSKADIEANYVKKINGSELTGLQTDREVHKDTYILKSNFDNQKLYSFTGTGNDTKEHDITNKVFYVTDERPTFIPETVGRAYTKQDVETNYILKWEGSALKGLNDDKEVDPNSYILKDDLDGDVVYSVSGTGNDTEVHDVTDSILYRTGTTNEKLLANVERGWTAEEIEGNGYIRPFGGEDLPGITTDMHADSILYQQHINLKNDRVYVFTDTDIQDDKDRHDITDQVYYGQDERPDHVPSTVKRAYTKEDVEARYVLKEGKNNLQGLENKYERSDLLNNTAYSFSGEGVKAAKTANIITTDLHYVGEERPVNVPTGVTRAYSAQEIEDNYKLKTGLKNIGDVKAKLEVNPNTYILKDTLKTRYYFSTGTTGSETDMTLNPQTYIEGNFYRVEPESDTDPTLKIKPYNRLVELPEKQPEGLYVLDKTTKKDQPTLIPVPYTKGRAYEVVGTKKGTALSAANQTKIEVDQKARLFDKTVAKTYKDEVGNLNWLIAKDSEGINLKGDRIILNLLNRAQPSGVRYTVTDMELFRKKRNKFKFRLFVGDSREKNSLSYGVLKYENGVEWKGENVPAGTKMITTFQSGAQQSSTDYAWEFEYDMGTVDSDDPTDNIVELKTLSLKALTGRGANALTKDEPVAIRSIQMYYDANCGPPPATLAKPASNRPKDTCD